MKLYAPNIVLFVISGCLAMLGVLASLPIELPIPALTGNSAWYIFLGWFLLSAGTALPPASEPSSNDERQAQTDRAVPNPLFDR